MGLNNLENRIRENKVFFNEEPSHNHLEKFQVKLSQLEKPNKTHGRFIFNSNRTFAVAASISIVLLISIFALLEFPNFESQPQLSEELMHVKMYYNQQTDKKIAEIKTCSEDKSTKDIYFETAEDRLLKLDNNTIKLEQKLSKAHGNKQLESAYIQSLKAKSEVVDQIYTQLCEVNTNSIITQ